MRRNTTVVPAVIFSLVLHHESSCTAFHIQQYQYRHSTFAPSTTKTTAASPSRQRKRGKGFDNVNQKSSSKNKRLFLLRASTETGNTNINVSLEEGNLEYRPDRDTDSQAYESPDKQWILQYHDIKTRRDVADARAQVCVQG